MTAQLQPRAMHCTSQSIAVTGSVTMSGESCFWRLGFPGGSDFLQVPSTAPVTCRSSQSEEAAISPSLVLQAQNAAPDLSQLPSPQELAGKAQGAADDVSGKAKGATDQAVGSASGAANEAKGKVRQLSSSLELWSPAHRSMSCCCPGSCAHWSCAAGTAVKLLLCWMACAAAGCLACHCSVSVTALRASQPSLTI